MIAIFGLHRVRHLIRLQRLAGRLELRRHGVGGKGISLGVYGLAAIFAILLLEPGEAFRSTLQITAADRTGLLADVTIKLSSMHIFIHGLNSRELKTGRAVVTVTIDVKGKNHLRGVISKLSDINGIEEIKRL